MIVDMHTHFVRSREDFGERLKNDLHRCGIPLSTWSYTEEQYLAGTADADKVVVFGLRAAKTGWNVPNDRVAAFAARHPEKYIFFTSIDPSEPEYMDALRFDHTELGCRGVKIGPIYQGVHPLDDRYCKIYEYCQQNRLPIITHMAATFSSGVPMDYARPIHMDAVACDFPKLTVVMAHLGHPWIAECVSVIRHQPNLYADISALYYRPWQFYNAMRTVEEYGAAKKILFGSDFPATTTAASIAGLRGVNHVIEGTSLPPVSESVIEGILHSDAGSILNLNDGSDS